MKLSMTVRRHTGDIIIQIKQAVVVDKIITELRLVSGDQLNAR